MRARGLFVTFEGGDGAGKGTQLGLLGAWLTDAGHRVVRTREPGGTGLGLELRELILHRPDEIAPRAEALMYAADRAQHVATVVRPALADGAIVLQDRYLDSSVAYQGSGRDLGADEVRSLSLWATDGLLPDLTVLLDIDPGIGLARVAAANRDREYDRLEAESLAFHTRVREAFLSLAAREPERWLVLDATASRESLADRIRSAVAGRLG